MVFVNLAPERDGLFKGKDIDARPLMRQIVDPDTKRAARNRAVKDLVALYAKEVKYWTGKRLHYTSIQRVDKNGQIKPARELSRADARHEIIVALIEACYAYDKKIRDKVGPTVWIWNKPRGWVCREPLRRARKASNKTKLIHMDVEDTAGVEMVLPKIRTETLSEQEYRVVSDRVFKEMPRKQIAAALGLSAMEIRAIEASALSKLKWENENVEL